MDVLSSPEGFHYDEELPLVVALGGGSTGQLHASVAEAGLIDAQMAYIAPSSDNGKASGNVVDEFGIGPPGDLRRSIHGALSIAYPEVASRIESTRIEHDHSWSTTPHPMLGIFIARLMTLDDRLDIEA